MEKNQENNTENNQASECSALQGEHKDAQMLIIMLNREQC